MRSNSTALLLLFLLTAGCDAEGANEIGQTKSKTEWYEDALGTYRLSLINGESITGQSVYVQTLGNVQTDADGSQWVVQRWVRSADLIISNDGTFERWNTERYRVYDPGSHERKVFWQLDPLNFDSKFDKSIDQMPENIFQLAHGDLKVVSNMDLTQEMRWGRRATLTWKKVD